MRSHRLVFCVAFVIVASTVSAQTQGELDEQACGEFHKADVALNATYARILKEYAGIRSSSQN
jgi:hypothetical protein